MEGEHSTNKFNKNITRFKSFIKRTSKISYKAPCKTYSFNVICKINEQPKSKGVFSTSLFGHAKDNVFYNRLVVPLLHNSENIPDILPGWCVRVYLSTKIPLDIKNKLIKNNCEVYMMNEDPDNIYAGTLWRFLCASENKPFIVWDADDYFLYEYKNVIEDWLESDKLFFRIKVGIVNEFIPITAGKWGGRSDKNGNPPFPDIKNTIEKYQHNWFGTDESFLHKEVWPELKRSNVTVQNGNTMIVCVILIVFCILITILLCVKKYGTKVVK